MDMRHEHPVMWRGSLCALASLCIRMTEPRVSVVRAAVSCQLSSSVALPCTLPQCSESCGVTRDWRLHSTLSYSVERSGHRHAHGHRSRFGSYSTYRTVYTRHVPRTSYDVVFSCFLFGL